MTAATTLTARKTDELLKLDFLCLNKSQYLKFPGIIPSGAPLPSLPCLGNSHILSITVAAEITTTWDQYTSACAANIDLEQILRSFDRRETDTPAEQFQQATDTPPATGTTLRLSAHGNKFKDPSCNIVPNSQFRQPIDPYDHGTSDTNFSYKQQRETAIAISKTDKPPVLTNYNIPGI